MSRLWNIPEILSGLALFTNVVFSKNIYNRVSSVIWFLAFLAGFLRHDKQLPQSISLILRILFPPLSVISVILSPIPVLAWSIFEWIFGRPKTPFLDIDYIQDIEIVSPGDDAQGADTAGEIIADIVAIHGLGSNSKTTWVHQASGKLWLRDFLAETISEEIPGARVRIMTFNYNSTSLVADTFESYADDLLAALEEKRRGKLKQRPIIFIGYSFGCIILKKALMNTRRLRIDHEADASFLESPCGAIFIGAPHNGSSLAAFGILQALPYYWLGARTELLEVLKPESPGLRSLHYEFMCTHGLTSFMIVNFYEMYNEKFGPFTLPKAAPYDMMTMDGGKSFGLPVHHRGLHRFGSKTDPNYQAISREIISMVREIKNRCLQGNV